MKIYISADIEGVAGITNWDEASKDSADYEEFRQQFTAEVAAACEGAIEAGASEIIVKDAHASGRNLYAAQLPAEVQIIRGWSGHPQSMMQDLDGSFDAAMMVGYHSAAASGGNPLAHTFHSEKVFRLTINEQRASEFLCNTYTAYLHKVPVVYVSGDKALCAEVSAFNSSIKTTAVTEGIGGSTMSLQPGVAAASIKRDVKAALGQDIQDFKCDLPGSFQVELIFKVHADAYKASHYPGASRINATTVSFASNDYLAVLTFLLFVI